MGTDVIYTPSGNAGEYANHGYALNLFDGCDHGCRYCYVPQVKHCTREAFHASVKPRKDILKRVESDLKKLGKVDEPIFLCFTCDPLAEGYLLDVTLPAIKLIHESGNRVRLLTKRLCTQLGLMDGDEYGVTLTVHVNGHKQEWEPNTADYGQRVFGCQIYREAGVTTWASFEPVIDPKQTLDLIQFAAPYLSFCKIGKANHLNRWNWPSDEWRRRVESIDWTDFTRKAVDLCTKLNLPYYIKNDLRPYLPTGANPCTIQDEEPQ